MQSLKPIEVVCWWDPALDMTIDERLAYAKSRDAKVLKIKAGERPTRYWIRPLTMAQMRHIASALTVEERNYRAFGCALDRVMHPRLADGSCPEEPVRGSRLERVNDAEIHAFTDADLEMLGCFAAEQEIGGVAYAHSYFRRPGAQLYPLPPTSDPVWTMADYLLAGTSPKAAPKNSDERREAPEAGA